MIPQRIPAGSGDQFRHDVVSPLTTIRARAQMLTRTVRRSSLTDEEQAKLLAGLASIEAAVLAAVAAIDGSEDCPTGNGRDLGMG